MKRSLHFLVILTTLAAGGCERANDRYRVVGELASDRVELTAEVSEPILEILVAEGEAVNEEQLLLRQDTERARARQREAEAALEEARARLGELVRGPRREQIEAGRASAGGAEQEVEFRQTEHERIRMLQEQGLASPDLLDHASAALDAANANLKLRRAQLEELLAGTTVEELAQAEQAVKRAEARLDGARIDLERHAMRAPVKGILDSRLFERGERPQVGQPVLVLLAGEQPYARVFVPENFRVRVAAGTPALVYVDGLADPLRGETRWVSGEAAFTPYYALTERDRGRLSYVAKIDITDDRPRLPDGVPVEVEFVLDQSAP